MLLKMPFGLKINLDFRRDNFKTREFIIFYEKTLFLCDNPFKNATLTISCYLIIYLIQTVTENIQQLSTPLCTSFHHFFLNLPSKRHEYKMNVAENLPGDHYAVNFNKTFKDS